MDLDEKEIEGETVKVLRSEIQNNAFDNWIEKAHKSSLDLARSLSGAKEGVDSLNQIIAWLIIGVAIVIWLTATGIATTKVIVLIASPVLAASFIFGDTCKTFFQGFMFAYVLHPFTVGDRCTINGSTEIMEVMRIGIWKTIFSKTSSKGEVIYPNSVLASSPIVNLTGIDPDHNDELSLISSIYDTEIDKLKQQTERFLMQSRVEELGDSTKLGIHFKHDETNFSDMLSTEVLESKTRMRDALLIARDKSLP